MYNYPLPPKTIISELMKSSSAKFSLKNSKKNLILITNKRIVPTEKMLKNSKIIELFDNYFSVDPVISQKKIKAH